MRSKMSHDSGEQHEDETELWMLPYSTLMLVLVILFIMFYSFSITADKSVEYESAIAEMASTRPHSARGEQARKEIALTTSMQGVINSAKMSDKAQVTISARFIKMKLESQVIFDSGSAQLHEEILPLFNELFKHLKDMDNMIIVEGHTDNIAMHSAKFRSNWELSAARAFSVIYFFINKGIDRSRLVAHGFGEFRPAFENDTESGRAKNRRIEITILRGGSAR